MNLIYHASYQKWHAQCQFFFSIKIIRAGTSLVVQWFRHCDSAAEGTGSIPQWGNMTLHAVWHGQEVENKIEHSHREV